MSNEEVLNFPTAMTRRGLLTFRMVVGISLLAIACSTKLLQVKERKHVPSETRGDILYSSNINGAL